MRILKGDGGLGNVRTGPAAGCPGAGLRWTWRGDGFILARRGNTDRAKPTFVMEPSPPMPAPPASAEPPPPPPMSLAARLLNVFAVPGDVFEEVKAARHSAANWLAPMLIASVVGVISVVILFSQPAIQQQLREKQAQAMEQNLEKQVQAGKLTREKADQQLAMMEKVFGPTMQKVLGSVGAVFYSVVRVFFWALVLWLLGRGWLHARFGYLKTLEVAGLAGMIGVLGAIVTLLLQVNFSNSAASPSLALAVGDFDQKNVSHVLLAMVNLFEVWQVGVLASGLARLAGVPFLRAAFPLLVVWMVVTVVLGGLSALAVRLGG